jgi:putative DNA primase/helicase
MKNLEPNGSEAAVLAELAALLPIEYDQRRETAAKTLGIRVSTLDTEVARLRQTDALPKAGGKPVTFEEPQPWAQPVAGTDLLGELRNTILRYVILPNGTATVVALWILHVWMHEAFQVSPILCINSPGKRCGKSTLLTLISKLVPRALPLANITASALFRAVELWRPTLLIDEADLYDNEELRSMINSGHTREGAFVIRTVGNDHEPRRFTTWTPKAIVLSGKIAPTLIARSVVISMQHKRLDEHAERLRMDQLDVWGDLRRKCTRWGQDNLARLREIDPEIPVGLNDQAADNWRPLLAIAEVTGAEWPRLAREVIKSLSGEDEAAGMLLLSDMRDIFTECNKIFSKVLAPRLASMEARPWSEWKDRRPITPHQIARLLKPFGVGPNTVRIGHDTDKGYCRDWFDDAFSRHLPPISICNIPRMLRMKKR